MRKIKFRVFDKREKVMHVVGDDTHDSLFVGLENELMYYNLQNGEGSGEEGDYTLMEYTGFKDYDGTEIYEGDILEGTFVVEEIDGSSYLEKVKSKVYFNSSKGAWAVKEEDGAEELLSEWIDCEKAKVIWNIYENTDLMNED